MERRRHEPPACEPPASWCYVCSLVDLYNRGDLLPLGGSLQAREARQGRLRDSRFPTPGIEASRNDRGDKFDNVEFVLMP